MTQMGSAPPHRSPAMTEIAERIPAAALRAPCRAAGTRHTGKAPNDPARVAPANAWPTPFAGFRPGDRVRGTFGILRELTTASEAGRYCDQHGKLETSTDPHSPRDGAGSSPDFARHGASGSGSSHASRCRASPAAAAMAARCGSNRAAGTPAAHSPALERNSASPRTRLARAARIRARSGGCSVAYSGPAAAPTANRLRAPPARVL